ncbi:MAG: holo-ACP synthase [Deltaproteobacteria bacterium]|jgi:holo-[acyl-carrier protein] synthase|nr:holo-ACP synthase [Deltaproteobacteria bacterium]MBW2579571.1 holo-ACP synthase [Deltaproteobacteria bacterium]MBW2625268.1 holo-ACP synthase [Deltaproteobacteria bacterium]MBW2721942.1 holo-ACP synthase [Deltaproteobacteria bacterium]
MIRGIGVDIVKVDRIEQAVERWGDRFLKRIFTPAEIERCQQRARPAQCLALRFAAKEAFAKALGLGMRKGLRWRDIEVVHDHLGKPDLLLHNQAQRLLEAMEASRTWLSLSDERESALAVVVLEG